MRTTLFVLGAALLAGAAMGQAGTQMQATMTVVGGAHRMFTLRADHPALRLEVKLPGDQNGKVRVRLGAEDLFGRRVALEPAEAEVPLEAGAGSRDVPIEPGPGYFRVTAVVEAGGRKATLSTDFGVVPPSHPGVRPDSFFASNTSDLKRGEDLAFLQRIGMKVQRSHFNARLAKPAPAEPNGEAIPLDFTEQDRALAEAKEKGLWVLPIVAYAFENTRTQMAIDTGMHGPPRDFDEFVNTWEQTLRHYPEIATYEFWNEPWIYGWTWAANAEEYRKLQTVWCRMALKVDPKLRIIAGNSSMFTEDHIEPYPDCWRDLIEGTTHHPYSGAGEATLRASGQARSIDHGMVVTRRMGLPYYYLTEGGSEYPSDQPDAAVKNNNINARKIVQYFVRAALVGAYQGNAQWGIGYGPEWTRANTTSAVMTGFLEDRPVLADIWPKNELIWGAIFASPRFATGAVRALPRAKELSARWNVPIPTDRAGDTTKVAVIWAETGPSADRIDTGGTLTIAEGAGLRAFDCTGREIPLEAGSLRVPFGEYPVYITSDTLDVVTLRERIAKAEIRNLTPVNLYALSLMQPANEEQKLHVRVENQMNRAVSGRLILRRAADGRTTFAPFTIPAAGLEEVALDWPEGKIGPASRYDVSITAETDKGRVRHDQAVAVARFAKRTIKVDGSLDDWEGVTPVVVDSAEQKGGIDLTQYLLNPNLKRPDAAASSGKRVSTRVYTAYDERSVYIAAAVDEPELKCTAGQPAVRGKVTLPYRQGEPDGMDHIRNCGDAFLLAFGFRDRVPGWGRQMDDPYAWKGLFYDTDYHYAAHISTDGAQLIRQWGPDTTRRIAYQTEEVPGYGPVSGAQIKVTRDEAAQRTVYEMAIPRSELALFNPKAGRLRFSFLVNNDENVGPGGALQWSEEAGVFEYWRSFGSFGPSWIGVLPCQTYFGIEQ